MCEASAGRVQTARRPATDSAAHISRLCVRRRESSGGGGAAQRRMGSRRMRDRSLCRLLWRPWHNSSLYLTFLAMLLSALAQQAQARARDWRAKKSSSACTSKNSLFLCLTRLSSLTYDYSITRARIYH